MDATAPLHPEPAFSIWKQQWALNILRGLAVVAGIAGALAGLFCAGLASAFAACTPESTGICTNFAAFVPALEWVLVIVAFGAPLAGGIASCVRRRWEWLPLGVVTAAAATWIAIEISAGQTSWMS